MRALWILDAVLLVAQAIFVVVAVAVLGTWIYGYHVSLAGTPSGPAAVAVWVLGGIGAIALLACAVAFGLLLRRAPGRFRRRLLIGCTIVQGVLMLLAPSLISWTAFGFQVVTFGALLWTVLHLESGADAEVRSA